MRYFKRGLEKLLISKQSLNFLSSFNSVFLGQVFPLLWKNLKKNALIIKKCFRVFHFIFSLSSSSFAPFAIITPSPPPATGEHWAASSSCRRPPSLSHSFSLLASESIRVWFNIGNTLLYLGLIIYQCFQVAASS